MVPEEELLEQRRTITAECDGVITVDLGHQVALKPF